jgi:hypothetical protein
VSEQEMGLPGRVAYALGGVKILADAGVIRPMRPDRLLRVIQTLARWGRSPAAGTISLADRFPDETAIVDELGTLTYRELHERSNGLAHAFSDAGILEGDGVAVMCRNHRGFIEATAAISKLGADALYLNTAFAAPQLTEVVGREKPKAIVYDEEFGDLLSEAATRRKKFIAWQDSDDLPYPTLGELVAGGDPTDVVPPEREGRATILTSGTTGSPKGASRANPQSLDPVISYLSRIPLKARQKVHIAAPLFHSWGFAHFSLGLILGFTYVLRQVRRLVAEGRGGERLGAARRPGRQLDGHLRRQPLQPVRLDRGGLGLDRHPGRHACGSGHGGEAAARHRREAVRRGEA